MRTRLMRTAVAAVVCLILPAVWSFAGGGQEAGGKAGGKVTVTLWHGLTAADGQYMERLMQRYTAEKNPNIMLEPTAIAWADLYTKMKTAYLSKSLPTLLIFHAQYVPIYAGNAIKPMDDIVAPLKLKEKLLPDFYDLTKYDGKTYYIPMTLVTAYDIFHRQDLVDLGFNPDNPPATFEELTSFGVKATQTVNGQKRWGIDGGYGYGSTWNQSLYSFGGQLLTNDGKRAAFNNQAGLQALNVFLDWWYAKQIMPRAETGSFDDEVKRFLNHGSSAWMTGTSAIGSIDSMGRQNMSFQHSPGVQGIKPATTAYFHGFALPRMGSKEADVAALEIVNWMLEPGINADFSQGSGQLPGVTAAYTTDIWTKNGWWLENNSLDKIRPIPYISNKQRDKIQESLDKWFNRVRDRQISAQEGLSGAEKEVNDILAE